MIESSLAAAIQIEPLQAEEHQLPERSFSGGRHFPDVAQRHAKWTGQSKLDAETEKRHGRRAHDLAAKFADYAAYHRAPGKSTCEHRNAPGVQSSPTLRHLTRHAEESIGTSAGDYHRARAAYEEAVQEEPENGGSLNNLAWSLSTCPDEALATASERSN